MVLRQKVHIAKGDPPLISHFSGVLYYTVNLLKFTLACLLKFPENAISKYGVKIEGKESGFLHCVNLESPEQHSLR